MKNKAISPLISAVIIVAMVLASTFIVLNQIIPTYEHGKEAAYIEEAKQAMSSIDAAIKEMTYESSGSKRTLVLKVPQGHFMVSGRDDSIKYIIETNSQLFEPGFISRDGNIITEYGPSSRAYESDINNDGSTDLVLENDALIFAVRKLHSKESPGFVNTTNSTDPVITLMKNKRVGENMTPILEIRINNMSESEYGQGYTELVETGENLPESAIRMYVNATEANLAYEVIFRLPAGQDYIQSEVKIR